MCSLRFNPLSYAPSCVLCGLIILENNLAQFKKMP